MPIELTATDIALLLFVALVLVPAATYLACKLGRYGYLRGEWCFHRDHCPTIHQKHGDRRKLDAD